MQKILFTFITSFLILTNLYGANFNKKATVEPQLVQQGSSKHWCPVCGMKIEDYYKTSYIAKLKMNGNTRQYCSMRCLVKDMQEYGIDENSIKVLNITDQKYIDAKNAFYVVKSKVLGTMGKVSKLAFENIEDANSFQKKI